MSFKASAVIFIWVFIALAFLAGQQLYQQRLHAADSGPVIRTDAPMVEIPAGPFIMGLSVEEAWALSRQWKNLPEVVMADPFTKEIPQLSPQLDTFFIDQFEVDNAAYRRCVETGPCTPPITAAAHIPTDYATNPAYDRYPVRGVNQAQADIYCRRLGKRLPSEAEWEKAARGNDGRRYPWGNDWPERAAQRPQDPPAPTGSHPLDRSPYGVYDLAGSAPEWTADLFLPYPGSPTAERYRTTVADRAGVLRGFGYTKLLSILAVRLIAHPAETGYGPGFRCAQGPTPPPLAQLVDSPAGPFFIPQERADLSRMVRIPAGEFIMGDQEATRWGERNDAAPAHRVYLDEFYIDRYEVTIAEFVAFLNAIGGHIWRCDGANCIWQRSTGEFAQQGIELGQTGYQVKPGFADLPITYIRWPAAQAYCRWAGKRLPSEAEWEKAARGTDGRKYPWGNDWDEGRVAGSQGVREGAYPFPVGSHPGDISPYGLYDMLGNADEWVADWYSPTYYYRSPAENPTGPPAGHFRTNRGISGPGAINGITVRRGGRGPYIGFRCAYTPAE